MAAGYRTQSRTATLPIIVASVAPASTVRVGQAGVRNPTATTPVRGSPMLSWIFLLNGARTSFTCLKEIAIASAAALPTPLGFSGIVGVVGGSAKVDDAAGVSTVASSTPGAAAAVGDCTGSLLVGGTATASSVGRGGGGVAAAELAPGVVGAVVAGAAVASDGTAVVEADCLSTAGVSRALLVLLPPPFLSLLTGDGRHAALLYEYVFGFGRAVEEVASSPAAASSDTARAAAAAVATTEAAESTSRAASVVAPGLRRAPTGTRRGESHAGLKDGTFLADRWSCTGCSWQCRVLWGMWGTNAREIMIGIPTL